MTASGLTSDSPPDGRDVPEETDGVRVGSVVAEYRLEEQIGHGGMAVVFRASDGLLRRQVAVKILAPALGADRAFRRRFVRESQAAALVDDPHIIPIYQAGQSGGLLFIAMRLVNGGDVRTLLRQHGSLPPARAAAILSPVASALDAAHAAGLVHRDVKPANMLLDVRPGCPDHVYLSDFGLSKKILSSPGLTGEGIFVGTPHYVAPEQINGGRVDGRTDQYSLACAAFELLSGVPPFHGGNAMAVIHAQAFDQAPPLTAVQPVLPSAVDAVFARALAKAPAGRYATCRDFAEALRAALGLPPYGSDPATAPGQDPTGPFAGSAAAGPLGTDTARREEAGDAGGRADQRRAAGRHRKRRWRLAAVAIAVVALLAGASTAATTLLGRHPGGPRPRHAEASSPQPFTPVPGSVLQGVTAVSAKSAWILGGAAWTLDGDCLPGCLPPARTSTPLIARWDGLSWSKIPSPVGDARLVAAADGPAATVWLVGYACAAGCGRSSEVDRTLILLWNGHALDPIPSPSPGREAWLAGVTTGPDGSAYAVGKYCTSRCGGTSEVDQTLLLSWNHGRWSRLHSASPGLSAKLTGVSAGPAGELWAVGYYCASACGTDYQIFHPLILHSGAGGWSSVTPPDPGARAVLSAVSVGADGTAWAVGGGSAGTLIMRWDTRRWHLMASVIIGAHATLDSVSISPGGTVWAVGSYCAADCGFYWQDDRTLIVQSGPRGWRVMPSPESAGSGKLTSVGAAPDASAWATGYSCVSRCGTASEVDRTLVLRWQGTRWTAG